MRTMSLNGRWSLSSPGKMKQIPARVPGDVYGDLLKSSKIPDPYYRDNELSLQWIGEVDWIYHRTFNVAPRLMTHRNILLRCEGLDTLATIRINGSKIGTTDNMFRTWEFDITRHLKEGRNSIEIRFASTVTEIKKKTRQYDRPVPMWVGPHKVAGGNLIRKEQCNYGWDWGPTLVTCGIWRSIDIVAFSGARIDDVKMAQVHNKGSVDLSVEIDVDAQSSAQLLARATLSRGKLTVGEVAIVNKNKAIAELTISDPELWWPNGLGDQPLYDIEIELLNESGRVLDRTKKRIGLRTLQLDRHKDKWGESFQFVVNGVPFFAKGANWIPADAILSRMNKKRYAMFLSSAAEANMNMLRVWGGGIYEDDDFYDLCDELGICVWQDFMFACATYPTFDPHFMANVEAEAADNIRRIRHHACLALWCGNNELEQGLVGPKWTESQMSWKDYSKLFDKALPALVKKLDPHTDYWPGSPHTPYGDRLDHQDPTCGDAHLWAVWHGGQPFEWYRTCDHRFNSEFGFQSFPEPTTVASYTQKRDRNITDRIMEHHQRSGIGNTTIMSYMLDWFRMPSSFEATLWLSQIQHGMAMKYAVEHWRRSMPRGMGTLYWQLNDCWPVASWASVDSFGNWKACNYMAKKFFAPVLVSGLEHEDKGTVDIHVTNDLRKTVTGTLSWTMTDAIGQTMASGSKRLEAKALADTKVETIDMSSPIANYGTENLMLWLDFRSAGNAATSNFVTFARPKHLELARPTIRSSVRRISSAVFRITLRTDVVALWTWLEVKSAHAATYSDNFVHLRPGRQHSVTIDLHKNMSLPEFKKRLQISSLFDTFES